MNEKPVQLLNKQQFFAKHREEYAGLTAKQRDERYDSYRQSVQPKQRRQPTVSRPPNAATVRRAPTAALKRREPNPALSLMQVMLDPFKYAEMDEAPPRVPDGEFKHTTTAWFKDRINVRTNADGRAAFIMRCAPWAATAASSVQSEPTTAAYQSDVEYNAYAVQAARAGNQEFMPPWTKQAWSLPAPHVQVNAASDNAGFQDLADASVLNTNALCWRPVAGGAKFKYIDAPLNAKGEVVGGHIPGAIGAPAQCTWAYTCGPEADSDVQDPSDPGTGLNFENAQGLPRTTLNAVIDGMTVIWTPAAAQAQTEWRSVKPKTVGSNFRGASYYAIAQLSNTLLTGEEVTPPPVTGSQARAEAVTYDLYAHNSAVNSGGSTGGTYGTGKDLFFGLTSSTAATMDLSIAQTKQTILRNLHRYDVHDQDNLIFMLFEGCVPDTLIGVVEVCVGVEWIADTRALVMGGARESARLTAPSHVQVDGHMRAVQIANAVPVATPTTAGAGSIFNDIQTAVRSGVAVVKDVAHGVMDVAELAAPLFAAL